MNVPFHIGPTTNARQGPPSRRLPTQVGRALAQSAASLLKARPGPRRRQGTRRHHAASRPTAPLPRFRALVEEVGVLHVLPEGSGVRGCGSIILQATPLFAVVARALTCVRGDGPGLGATLGLT